MSPGPEDPPVAGSQPLEAASDPMDQDTTGSRLLDATSGPKGQEPSGPEPMEVDAPDPLERVQSVQRLVYYISEVLHDAKTGYLEVHKLLYVVLIASRKLHHYFQAHKISVGDLIPTESHAPQSQCD
jgi:hypothetical protein